MPGGPTEAFSRVLIDKALEFSGWNLLDVGQVRFELNGTTGRADYVLCGTRGPLCVLEAKREDLDPYDAKEQARGYAENLKAPFIILSKVRGRRIREECQCCGSGIFSSIRWTRGWYKHCFSILANSFLIDWVISARIPK